MILGNLSIVRSYGQIILSDRHINIWIWWKDSWITGKFEEAGTNLKGRISEAGRKDQGTGTKLQGRI